MQWIAERDADHDDIHRNEHFKNRDDFLRFMVQVDREASNLIDSLTEYLMEAEDPPEVGLLMERFKSSLDANMLLTMACASVLGKSPELATWLKVRAMANNSWEIEHWLHEAMAANVQRDPSAREPYISLATLLFKTLESGELKSGSERKSEHREGALSYWNNAEHQLEELWWGLRDFDFMNYEEEMRIFGLLSEISPSSFLQLIGESFNPFLVDAALTSSGVGAFSPRFTQWEACARTAPNAFAQDGRWNRSVLLPLLLVHARGQLLAPSRQFPRYGADETAVAVVTTQVIDQVRVVVDVLSKRKDAPAMFARWSTWLMRQVVLHKETDFSDIRAQGFVDNALIEAMGKAMQGQTLIQEAPEDAAPWEVWCYRCVRSSFAHDGFMETPSFNEFASQWRLSPEDWHERKGRDLLKQAELHIPRHDMPGLSANLLAFPLVSEDGFFVGWKKLWEDAYYLREVLEFGSVDAAPRAYSDRSDASGLLLLLACVGLACFDQAMARLEASSKSPTEQISSLHETLSAAAMEALHIDDTLNRDKWQTLLHHIALRRAYWDNRYGIQHPSAVFMEQKGPTIQDYLSYFHADPNDLVSFLYACMLNKMDPLALREDLLGASIDLCVCVETLKRLNKVREHRYPIDGRAIAAIQPLMSFG